jgi:GT2 family glycosyltransferase
MSAEVDVVVVTFGHAGTVASTLAGLAAQTLVPSKIVVVDNGSVDGSLEIVGGWRYRLPLEVVSWAENRGFSAAMNEGVRRSRSPFVMSLNPDCRLAPEFLASLVGECVRRPRVGAACGLLLRGRGEALAAMETVDSAGMVVAASGRHTDRGAGEVLRTRWLRPALVFGATGAAALFRRAALDDVAYGGGEVFDEGFFAYREDADVAWRLQRRGWSCLYWPSARGYHARGLRPEARRRGTVTINRMSVRNRFLLRMANADWRWHLLCFPWWLLRDLVVAVGCVAVERSSLPGLREAWALRGRQLARGRLNRRRALVSGWRLARMFLPGGRVREVGE